MTETLQTETSENNQPAQDDSAEQPQFCFVITPIGPDDSTVRRSAEGILDAVIIRLEYLSLRKNDHLAFHALE